MTGQDAELAGIQRILRGDQLMTVYQPIIDIAETSAELAVPIAQGKEPPADLAKDKVDNGMKQVPSVLLDTFAVQPDNIDSTVVKEGFLDVGDICTAVRGRLQGGRPRVTPAALAVDAGQTRIRAALDEGRAPRSASAPGVVRVGSAAGGACRRAAAGGGRGARPLPDRAPPAAIGPLGLRGAGPGATRPGRGRPSGASVGVERLAIATDGLTALLGAIGRRDGVVVAAGTGTACLGRRGDRFAKVDGWGSLLSDAGSGFAIGRAGLDAALGRTTAAADRRG